MTLIASALVGACIGAIVGLVIWAFFLKPLWHMIDEKERDRRRNRW